MTIVILGPAMDAHAAHLYEALVRSRAPVKVWDTSQFPTRMQACWSPTSQAGALTFLDGERLPLDAIKSVFWRSFAEVQVPALPDEASRRIAHNDAMSLTRSLLQLESIHWVNSWRAYQFHKEKPLQLAKVQELGVRVPETLVGNDAIAILDFVQHHAKAISKPVYGGAHTQLVHAEHLDPERLRLSLKIAPVTIQEYIAGTNIRTYVIGNAVFSAEIRSEAMDFREDQQAEIIPVELPKDVERSAIAIRQALFLEWTAIDWRLTPSGEFVFLEANPSPMFIHFENMTRFPITEALINLLTH